MSSQKPSSTSTASSMTAAGDRTKRSATTAASAASASTRSGVRRSARPSAQAATSGPVTIRNTPATAIISPMAAASRPPTRPSQIGNHCSRPPNPA
jgi:hypothetical protein